MNNKDLKEFIDLEYSNKSYSELYDEFKPLVEKGALKGSRLVSYLKKGAIGSLIFRYDDEKLNKFSIEYSDIECDVAEFATCICGGKWVDGGLSSNDCECDKCGMSMMEYIIRCNK